MVSAVHLTSNGILGERVSDRDKRKYVLVAIKDVDKHPGCALVYANRGDICKDAAREDGRTHYHRCATRIGYAAAATWVNYYNKLGWKVTVMDRVY